MAHDVALAEGTGVDAPASAEEREFRWEAALRDRLAPMTVRVDAGGADRGGVRGQDLADVLLTDWDCPGMDGLLTRAAVQTVEIDAVAVMLGYAGQERLCFAGTDVALDPGSLVVLRGGGTGRFSVPRRAQKRTVVLPRAALEAAGSGRELPGCLLLEADRPLVRLFTSFLDQVWRQLPEMNAAETEAARNTLVALTAGVVRSQGCSVTDSSALPALRARLDEWIARNLQKGPIRVEELAAAHSVSPRTVHRAFAMTGDTMTSVVRARRLAAVRAEILDTNLTLSAIAHRWGYYDPSHLGREFRRVYGATPGEYRQAHQLYRPGRDEQSA
jgi:AraC family transcriptional activator of tynA and feaB